MFWRSIPFGQELTRIEYELFDWEERPSSMMLVDDVAMAVRLGWKTFPLVRVTWRTPGYWYEEGLRLGGQKKPNAGIVDVSERWSELIGGKLENVEFSRTLFETHLVWALNLKFGGGAHLVIALGEVKNNVPSYAPDNLIITTSETIARAYWPSSPDGPWTDSSAWGR
jgi:hypothetical protein